MKDLPALFKAFIIPYIICCSITTICWMTGTGQEVPEFLWGIFVFFLGEEGIKFGIGKIRKTG